MQQRARPHWNLTGRVCIYVCRRTVSTISREYSKLYTTSCGKEGVTEGRDRDYLENKVKLGSSVGGTARPGLVSCAISSRPRLLRLVLSLHTVLGHTLPTLLPTCTLLPTVLADLRARGAHCQQLALHNMARVADYASADSAQSVVTTTRKHELQFIRTGMLTARCTLHLSLIGCFFASTATSLHVYLHCSSSPVASAGLHTEHAEASTRYSLGSVTFASPFAFGMEGA